MNKFSVLIVDDEPIQRRIMREYCTQSRFFEKIAEAKDGVEALELIHQAHYDLLLLDINMPVLSGLSLAKSIKTNTKVIFVTAYAEHAVEAFELSVIDYLLKPVSFERFIKAIQKLIPENNMGPATETKSFISVKQGKKSVKVNVDDILYCEAKGNSTFIYLTDKTHLEIYSPLTKLLSELPKESFTQVHRAFVISNNKVKAVENNLLYVGGLTIPVGGNFKDGLKKFL
ncbi:MAG: response regulator transcription factor [Chitinophagales bacterium]|nr:response regulator transcription factor [Chitinophagales bacterium]